MNWAVTGVATSNQYGNGKWFPLFGAAIGVLNNWGT